MSIDSASEEIDENVSVARLTWSTGYVHSMMHVGMGLEYKQPKILAEGFAQAVVHHDYWYTDFLHQAEDLGKKGEESALSMVECVDLAAQHPIIKNCSTYDYQRQFEGEGEKRTFVMRKEMIKDGVCGKGFEPLKVVAARYRVDPNDLERETAALINAACKSGPRHGLSGLVLLSVSGRPLTLCNRLLGPRVPISAPRVPARFLPHARIQRQHLAIRLPRRIFPLPQPKGQTDRIYRSHHIDALRWHGLPRSSNGMGHAPKTCDPRVGQQLARGLEAGDRTPRRWAHEQADQSDGALPADQQEV